MISDKVLDSPSKYSKSEFSLVLDTPPKKKVGSDEKSDFSMDSLREIKTKYWDRIVIGCLNINSLRNKFDLFKEFVQENLDVIIIIETKLDDSFPSRQFEISNYSGPFRCDRNRYGGGVMVFVKNNIPSMELKKFNSERHFEGIFLELNLRKQKMLLFSGYRSEHEIFGLSKCDFLHEISLGLDQYSKYDKFLLAGDFNMEGNDAELTHFIDQFNAKCLVKEPTCFKSDVRPSTVDHFITNAPRLFQSTKTLSTGLSDFHKMIITVMKYTIPKSQPRELTYRNYNNFDQNSFETELEHALVLRGGGYNNFDEKFIEILNKHAPIKTKLLRANHKPFITKQLRKAMMKTSQLQKRFWSNKTEENRRLYKKQRNFKSRLCKREKQKFIKNIDLKDPKQNKKFWETVKPFFSDKGNGMENITLVDGDEIITDNQEIANTFNKFFDDAVDELGDFDNESILTDTGNIIDPVQKAIKKFERHPSILKIQDEAPQNFPFSFIETTPDEIALEISALNPKKACPLKSIPVKILQNSSNIVKDTLAEIFNREIIGNKKFPSKLKLADLTPIHKKLAKISKKNYRPVSILPLVSKIFERILKKQMNPKVESFLSPYLCGYRKGFSTEYALVSMIEKWKKILDQGGYAGGILMDLSKAFDTINHELLVAKLNAYGFEESALKIIMDYLSDRWQRTRVSNKFSSWSELLKGVPQGSILGPIFFNIYYNDFLYFLENTDMCNLADDSTPFACGFDIDEVLSRLETDIDIAIDWFYKNFMKLNEDKCHFILAGYENENTLIRFGDNFLEESEDRMLLGVTIDNELKFDKHIRIICKEAGKKINALSRLVFCLNASHRKICLESFINSLFNYGSLAWMFCTRKSNNMINHVHERALRIAHNDYSTDFNELLKKVGSETKHIRNVKKVAVEMFKIQNNMSKHLISELFVKNDFQNTRSGTKFQVPNRDTVFKGEMSLRTFGVTVWNELLPTEFKMITNLDTFKEKLKKWVPNCRCRLCKTYVQGVGFVSY